MIAHPAYLPFSLTAAAAVLAASATLSIAAPEAAATTTCDGTMTISSGGVFTGCWSHVSIRTTARVEIRDSTVTGPGKLFDATGAVNVDIHDSSFSGAPGEYVADFADWSQVRFVHNEVTTKAGLKLNRHSGNANPAAVLTNNSFRNINVPGSAGYRQMFQFADAQG